MAVIHDDGYGTEAASAAVVAAVVSRGLNVSIKAIDINDAALDVYRKHAAEGHWLAHASKMGANSLDGFVDDTFMLSLRNALLFVLPVDGIDAVKGVYRTLKPGVSAVFNSWRAHLCLAPAGLEKWSRAGFLKSIAERGRFEKAEIDIRESPVVCDCLKMDRFGTMLSNYIGTTSSVGWLKLDEQNR
ncbi:hypothetical protein F5Y16DRAFT_401972 [Xylariaceae sp. FL0255]|nr:hypothetical protein F5Y16DRAFT_401972 [Xylariaceae sp. FL0255]